MLSLIKDTNIFYVSIVLFRTYYMASGLKPFHNDDANV